jgi:hypothetical protein
MATLLVIVTVVIALALIAWFFVDRSRRDFDREPDEVADSDSSRFYSRVDRPAGPDAESMDPDVMLGHPEPPRGP